MKIVQAIKEGRFQERYPDKKQDKDKKPPVFMIWNEEQDEVLAESRRYKFHLPAPKVRLA